MVTVPGLRPVIQAALMPVRGLVGVPFTSAIDGSELVHVTAVSLALRGETLARMKNSFCPTVIR